MSCNGVACTPVWERQPKLADLPECKNLTILPWNYPPQVTCGRCNNATYRRAPLDWNNIGFVPNVPGVNTYYSYVADHGTEYWYAMCSSCNNTSKNTKKSIHHILKKKQMAPVLRSLAPVPRSRRSQRSRRRKPYVAGVTSHLVYNVETENVCNIVATDVYSIDETLRKGECAHVVLWTGINAHMRRFTSLASHICSKSRRCGNRMDNPSSRPDGQPFESTRSTCQQMSSKLEAAKPSKQFHA